MARENLTYEDLLQIVELIKSSEQFSEFRLKIGEIEIELRRRRSAGMAPHASPVESRIDEGAAATLARAPASAHAPAAAPHAEPEAAATSAVPASSAAAANRAAPAGRSAATAWAADAIVVRAPMVGTFYRSPAPGAPPFVSVGQSVDADTTVCIIEVMKLMNSIPAGASGVVTHVLVGDGEPVDASAPLVVLDPRRAR